MTFPLSYLPAFYNTIVKYNIIKHSFTCEQVKDRKDLEKPLGPYGL
jgi:hypothetical protein